MQSTSIKLHKRALLYGVLTSVILSVLVHIGSRRLLYFDAALMPYLFATLFALMGIVYRYTVWLDRPPTRRLWKRSLQVLFEARGIERLGALLNAFIQQVILQRFIQNRGFYRWLMHFSLAWGTMLAFAVTFPLVFGWLHFETVAGQPHLYQLYVFGFPQFIFHPDKIVGFLFFNALNFSSLMVILGTVMAFTRRILHPDRVANQSFLNDLLPLLILYTVAVTGLFLTFSMHFLEGQYYRLLSAVHCFTVVVFLVYLPFGKFFHIFQRGAQMGAALYIRQKLSGELARCLKCNTSYTSLMQSQDVKDCLREAGFKYESDNQGSVQDLCPLCRRKLLMWGQHRQLQGHFDLAHRRVGNFHG
jgi:nitrate reductase gamma subunit